MAADQVQLGYSPKNIPMSSRKDFRINLIKKTKTFLRAMTYRATFFLSDKNSQNSKENYGFRTTKEPARLPELREFEDSLLDMIENIEFKEPSKNTGQFQSQLNKDSNTIKSDTSLYVKADKSSNYYRMDKNKYEQFCDQNIQKTYKKSNENEAQKIVQLEKKIACNLDIEDRMDTPSRKEAYITLKDHKPNFRNNPTFRLINPNKGELGRVSKQILQRINVEVREKTALCQWRSTGDVINWFNNIQNKEKCHFIQYDIVEYYPNVTEKLLPEALNWAKIYTAISDEDKKTIITAKNTLLFQNSKPWKKKNCDNLFDNTMGSFDGAESCELVGLYVLSQLKETKEQNGLYRDDGLMVSMLTKRQNELLKKRICEIFQKNGLKITINTNLKIVDFLDVTFDLENDLYKPYLKPNNVILYVNIASNHPPSIVKNIPESINKRLNSISKTEEIFENSIGPYQEALNKAGYTFKLHWVPPAPQNFENKRRRQRNITWYNPPYCKSVKTNIGAEFFKILKRCFPPNSKLHKIFNKNTVKLSYSCMPNIGRIISGQNKKILKKVESTPPCKCTQFICPLEGKCETKGVIYQCKVTETNSQSCKSYIGLTEHTFKNRYTKWRSAFKNEGYHKNTLSNHVWYLKRNHIDFVLSWQIVAKAEPYSPAKKCCDLCIREIFFIMYDKEKASLNKRNEFFNPCPHRAKFLLSNQ